MSNMLYAISILYKTKLPMILVFNKTDVKEEGEAVEWMRDFESFQAALRRKEDDQSASGAEGGGYMGSLLNSMSLVLEEFYNHLSVVGVSSMTGSGIDEFFVAVEGKKGEFEKEYRPELEKRRREAEGKKEEVRKKEVERMMGDMEVSSKFKGSGKYSTASSSKASTAKRREEPETVSEAEEMEEDGDEDEVSGLVDPDGSEDGGMEEEGEETFEEGLKARYEQALKDSPGGAGMGMAAAHIRGSQR